MVRSALISLCLVGAVACKKDAPEVVVVAPAAPGAAAAAAAPNDPAQAMAQMQRAMGALAPQPGSKPGQAVTPVNWRDLLPLLSDDVAGWKADGEGRGSSTSMGAFQITQVERKYKKGDARASIKIVDTSFYQPIIAGWQIARSVAVDSSDEYQRAVDVGGQPGIEKWRKNKRGDVNILVAGRFMVSVEGGEVPDAKGLVALAGSLNLAKLAASGK